ncbi:DUF1289 domain-containing protein [Thalassotalea agariperforans]
MTENETIASPCIRNCCLNEEDVCLGCFRHIDEILAWGKATNEQKLTILSTVEQRKQAKNVADSFK